MKMLSPANGDQLHLVNYVEDYLDSIESMPFDLQRNVSLMREIDAKYQGKCFLYMCMSVCVVWGSGGRVSFPFFSLELSLGSICPSAPHRDEILKDLDDYYEKFKRETDAVQKRRMLHCIQRALIRSQELGDEKIQIVSQMVELVENRTRQVDSHVELFETCQETNDTTGNSGKASQDKSKNETIAQAEKPNNKRSRRQRNNENRENASNNHDHDDITSGTPKEKKAKTSKKKKRSKAKAEREASPPDLPIDPNEPTYCLCNQVSYGEMIGCDNDECPIEWFHFSCVGLNHKPKGKWYCPKCRGENEKTMDKALEKSKKERAYNR
ncbi:inhibitor of growth protein 1 isoform 3-T4 [Sylvia borin]